MTNLIAARRIQDIERDQHEMSEKFEKLKDGQLIDLISNIGGKAKADISIYGQESNDTPWRLARPTSTAQSVANTSRCCGKQAREATPGTRWANWCCR